MGISATFRDFHSTHPDFERADAGDAVVQGLVQPTLGPKRKPVYAHPGPTSVTAGPDAFAQWYEDVPGINLSFVQTLPLSSPAQGQFVFDSAAFFPLDGQGFGNEGNPHNFHFTTEIHTAFVFKAGQQFTFRGDDDVWVFVNGKLAIDLGGLHQPQGATIDFSAQAASLGLVEGTTYALDVFHAERHTVESNFRFETSIDCFLPPVIN